jgi:hypothetical protein
MDKTKLSICITGLLMCAMSYANISGSRGDMHLQEADTLALTYVSVAPEAITAPAAKPPRRNAYEKDAHGKNAHANNAPRAAQQAGGPLERSFDTYLRLHQSRVETPPAEPMQHAALH